MSGSTYKYVQYGGRYICLEQNLLNLGRLLYLRNRELRSLGSRARSLTALLIGQCQFWKKFPTVELPVFGNFGLRTNKGLVLFDLHRDKVVKIFSPQVDRSCFLGELEKLQAAKKFNFASSIQAWNVESQTYEVDYFKGERGSSIAPSDPKDFLGLYRRYIEPLFEQMASSQPPVRVELAEYVGRTIRTIRTSLRSKMAVARMLPEEDISRIRSFMDLTIDRLQGSNQPNILLTFSHGDCLPQNIIKTQHGVKVIDWEHAGERSVLHDLYNYFFARMFFSNRINLVEELNEAIRSFQSYFRRIDSDVAHDLLILAPVYRWLFYLERICVLLEREKTQVLLRVIQRTLDIFERYETVVARGLTREVRTYNCHFQDDLNVDTYENEVYNKDSYDSFLWSLQQSRLTNIFTRLRADRGRLKHLDFACGSGRILSFVEGMATESVGIDISSKMLSAAKGKVKKAKLYQGDILEAPAIVDFDYDIITAFRFFRHADDELRKKIMAALRSRLCNANSRLVFNIHHYEHGVIFHGLGQKFGQHKPLVYGNWISRKDVVQLLKDAGMEVDAWYGFGIFPARLHRGILRPIARFIDRLAARIQILRDLSTDLVFVCKARALRTEPDLNTKFRVRPSSGSTGVVN